MSNEKIEQRRQTADRLAREYEADGIIYENVKFCDFWGFERALASHIQFEEYGHPVLTIDRPYNAKTSGQLRTASRPSWNLWKSNASSRARRSSKCLRTTLNGSRRTCPATSKFGKSSSVRLTGRTSKNKQVNKLNLDKQRVKEEFNDFMALPAKEKWDRVVNGERQLGRLYQKGAIAFTRREWKGVESTARDFQTGWSSGAT